MKFRAEVTAGFLKENGNALIFNGKCDVRSQLVSFISLLAFAVDNKTLVNLVPLPACSQELNLGICFHGNRS